jgi:hypothetical protein
VSDPKDEIVTITVNIDAPGISDDEAEKWKNQAETVWNEGFGKYPAQCYKLQLVVNVYPQDSWEIDKGPRPGRHLIFRGRFVEAHGALVSGVRGSNPLEKAAYGAWDEDVTELEKRGRNAYAHEVGHLLGLKDEYDEQPATDTSPRKTTPKPNRKDTLMADGGRVDKKLVDTLTEVLRDAHKLPSCWHGKIRSESTQDYRSGGFFKICTEVWDIKPSLRVSPDGAVTGKATGTFVAHKNSTSNFNWDPSRQAQYAVFSVQGHFDQQRFELQFAETDVEHGLVDARQGFGGRFEGFLNYTLFIGSDPGPQPTIIVPVVAPDRAEGTTTIRRRVPSGADATGIHVVHLTREDSAAKAAVG